MSLSEHYHSGSTGSLDFPKTNKPVEVAILCIQQGLELFAAEFKATPIQNEPGLTQELCDLLNDVAGDNSFWFDKENMQDTSTARSPRTDIGVKTREIIVIKALTFQKRSAFFELEAKRLPAPEMSREKEYVIGNKNKMGGIERFKIGKHGQKVLYGGLIGFVQQEDFSHWQAIVNGWIEELFDDSEFWNASDKLKVKHASKTISVFTSESKRSIGVSDFISLHHWWVKMF